MAQQKNIQILAEKKSQKEYVVTLTLSEDDNTDLECKPMYDNVTGPTVVVFSSNKMGEGDDTLGGIRIPQFIIGVKGLAGFLGTSVSTVNRWKACGLLDDATLQCGKVVIFELPKVIEILRVSDKKNKFNVKS